MNGNEWCRRKRQELIALYGGRCVQCGIQAELEFAHPFPTEVVGRGRGQNHRTLDVIRNPLCYTLMCPACHLAFDRAAKSGGEYSSPEAF